MDNLFDGNRITIDMVNYQNDLYRISFFDKNYHFDNDIELDKEQMLELKDAFEKINLENN